MSAGRRYPTGSMPQTALGTVLFRAPTDMGCLEAACGSRHACCCLAPGEIGRDGGRFMNGAESLVRTLVGGGVNVCFANPGTSEMHFVAALDRVEGMRCILGLFEGVVTGAADGYARMTGSPAATLLHLGPGMANGLANIHNANKASTPMVNIVGDHATYHRRYDAPLTTDIETAAKPFSRWVKTSPDARSVAADGAAAIAAARTPPGQIATLILPADTAWNEGSGPVEVSPAAAGAGTAGSRRRGGAGIALGRAVPLARNGPRIASGRTRPRRAYRGENRSEIDCAGFQCPHAAW